MFTTKTQKEGACPGLLVIKQFVEQYNGSIGFQSVPSQGTAFTVTLPGAADPLK